MTRSPQYGSTLIASIGASATIYGSIAAGYAALSGTSTVEAGLQTPQRTPGSYSNLSISVLTNDRGNSTLRFRTGGGNGNQSILIPANTTGVFTDVSNQDAVPGAGELVNMQLVTGSGGTTFTLSETSILFAPTASGNTVTHLLTLGAATTQAASLTRFQALSGLASGGATEANVQFKNKLTATLRNMFIFINVNGRSDTTTFKLRKGGADGSSSCAIGASTTGIVEDTTHTDSIASGDLVNYSSTTGAGTGTITFGSIGIELLTTNNMFHVLAGGVSGGVALANNLVRYYPLSGYLGVVDATFGNVAQLAGTQLICKNLEVFVVSNTYADTTYIFGPPTTIIVIAAGVTGYIETAGDDKSYGPTGSLFYQVNTPNDAGHSITFNCLGMIGVVNDLIPARPKISSQAVQRASYW